MKKITLILVLTALLLTGCWEEDQSIGSRVGDKKNYTGYENLEKDFQAQNKPSENVVIRESEKLKQERAEMRKQMAQGGQDLIEVTDRIFVNLINEIYLNRQDYVGRMIRLSGNACEMKDPASGEELHAVLRIGPGCCGNDGVVGFEYAFDGDYPPKDSWIEVTGELELVPIGPANIVRIQAKDVKVLPERGLERVTH